MKSNHGGAARQLRALLLTSLLSIALAGLAPRAMAAEVTRSVTLSAIGVGGARRLPNGAFFAKPGCRTGVDQKVQEEARFAVEFDLSTIPSDAAISSAQLRLRSGTPDKAGATAIYGYAGDGSATLADLSAGSLLTTFTPSTPSPEDHDVTAFVVGQISASGGWAGFGVRQEPLGSSYSTWDCLDNANPPRLIVTYLATDTIGPSANPTQAPAATDFGWNNSDVTVSWNWADDAGGVGIDSSNCTTASTSSGEGEQTLSASCNDLGGNTGSASATVRVDKAAPTISAAATSSPNVNNWYNGDVTVHFSCDDKLSGVASCPADQTLSAEGADVSSTAQSVNDKAGNTSASSNIVTVAIDRSAPTVSVIGVTNGASYPLGSVPAAGCTTSDELSKVGTEATLTITGGNADGTGSFTAMCSGATDKAGNPGSASVSYTVAYRWSGFLEPIDNLPTLNSVKAGSAVPVTFSLGGNYGLSIFASGYPKVQQVACGSSAPTDEVEQTVTAGASGLKYDAASGKYTYTWKTDKKWAGTCRQLVLKLVDGTEHIAGFQFK